MVRCRQRDVDAILDADTGEARNVDAGFNGEAHARLQLHVVALHDGWELMGASADAVTQAVVEVFTIAGLGDDVPGDFVEARGGDPRLSGLHSG